MQEVPDLESWLSLTVPRHAPPRAGVVGFANQGDQSRAASWSTSLFHAAHLLHPASAATSLSCLGPLFRAKLQHSGLVIGPQQSHLPLLHPLPKPPTFIKDHPDRTGQKVWLQVWLCHLASCVARGNSLPPSQAAPHLQNGIIITPNSKSYLKIK